MIKLNFNVKVKKINFDVLQNRKPSIIVANHQSFLDILFCLTLHPKIIIMVNDWVWNSPIFGQVVKFLDFVHINSDHSIDSDKVKRSLEKGFSIVVFPEGTRSLDGSLNRFKKGAFLMAKEFNLDVLPLMIHGANECLTKGDFKVNSGQVTLEFLPKVSIDDFKNETYQTLAKEVSASFKNTFHKRKSEIENNVYWYSKVSEAYIYKGPIPENYVSVKLKIEHYYDVLSTYIPRKGKIVELGCGMGYLVYLLAQSRKDVSFLGVDYDEHKIAIANSIYLKTPNIEFISDDFINLELPNADAFIMLDVLHYLNKQTQELILKRVFDKMNEEGVFIIKDGFDVNNDKHKSTLLSEKIASFLGFNKGNIAEFQFMSIEELENICEQYSMKLTLIDFSKKTSNRYYLIHK